MQYFKFLIATGFVQGGLSAKILAYEGRDCTGTEQALAIADDSCVEASSPFRSYKENGWGSKDQRIHFYGVGGCSASELYDTWAYDGDYFGSHTCYNLNDHPQNGGEFGNSVASKK